MPSTGFADEYRLCRQTLEGQSFGGALSGLADLTKALGAEGPELNFYGKVTHFRDVTLKFKEAEKIAEAAGVPEKGLVKDDAIAMAAGVLVAGAIAGCTTPPTPSKEKRMSFDDEMSFSRIGPPDLAPVDFEGRRYTQIDNGERDHLDQRTGYLAVTDIATGQRITAVKVYEVAFDPDLEADVQDVLFIRLELQAAERRLLIENEHVQSFYVSLDGYAVTPAPGP